MMMTKSTFTLLACGLPEDREDDLAEALTGIEVLGSEVGEPSLGMVPVKVYLAASSFADEPALRHALEELGAVDLRREDVQEQDWLASYRRATNAFPVGRLWWLDPHPECPTGAPEGRVPIVVEPRMAFGTGSHESTQLVLLELEELQLEGASVLDVGSGSGILSLAAMRRGAAWAVGFDNDAQSVWVARQIAKQQRPPLHPCYLAATVDCLHGGAFQLILCNMISDHFLPMLEAIRSLLAESGQVVFSGILNVEAADVRAGLADEGLRIVAERALGEWLCMRAVRG